MFTWLGKTSPKRSLLVIYAEKVGWNLKIDFWQANQIIFINLSFFAPFRITNLFRLCQSNGLLICGFFENNHFTMVCEKVDRKSNKFPSSLCEHSFSFSLSATHTHSHTHTHTNNICYCQLLLLSFISLEYLSFFLESVGWVWGPALSIPNSSVYVTKHSLTFLSMASTHTNVAVRP